MRLRAEGLTFDLKDIVLVDAAGKRVPSMSGGGSKQDKVQDLSLNFTRADFSGDPTLCHLAFAAPGAGEQTIGPIGTLVPKPAAAGATVVRITRTGMGEQAGMELFEVHMEFDGFPASPDEIVLVCGDARPLKPRGWGGGGHVAQCWFDPQQIRGKEDSCRLQIQAPTKVTEHVLRASFDDVPLEKAQ